MRFQLSVSVPAAGTLAAQTRTDAVVIVVNPPPNRIPAVTALASTPDATSSTPAAGSTIGLVASATDPDGDPVTFSWRAWRGTASAPAGGTALNTTAGASNSRRNLVWPAATPQLTVEVTARDGRGGVATRLFVLGAPLAPIQLTIGGSVAGSPIGASTPAASAGAAVVLTTSTNRVPSGGITWTLVSGPANPRRHLPADRFDAFVQRPDGHQRRPAIGPPRHRDRHDGQRHRDADDRVGGSAAAFGVARRLAGNRRAARARFGPARLPATRAHPAGRAHAVGSGDCDWDRRARRTSGAQARPSRSRRRTLRTRR